MTNEEIEEAILTLEVLIDECKENGSNNACKEWDALDVFKKLHQKYNKALELLCEYNMPCEIDDFMDKNTDYCSINCSVNDEVFKECWNRFIEEKLEKRE